MIIWTAFLVGLRVHISEIFAYVAKELDVLNFVPRVHFKTFEILSFQCGAKVGYATYYPSIPASAPWVFQLCYTYFAMKEVPLAQTNWAREVWN